MASQPAFHWGKLCPLSLLKHHPSPHSTAPLQISPFCKTAPPQKKKQNTLLGDAHLELNQRRSAKWLVQEKPLLN